MRDVLDIITPFAWAVLGATVSLIVCWTVLDLLGVQSTWFARWLRRRPSSTFRRWRR